MSGRCGKLEGSAGRPFRPMELREIARACDLPYAFFTSDFWLLDTIEENWPDEEQALGPLKDLTDQEIIQDAFEALRNQLVHGPRRSTRTDEELENLSAPEILEEMRSMWVAVAELSRAVGEQACISTDEVESVLRGATRRTKQLLADPAAETAAETEAAANTRDEADASPGDARAPGATTPRTGRTTAR